MQVESNRYFRVKQLAEMLDVSRATIYRAIESGQLDALKIGTGKGALRIPGHAVNTYLETCAEAAYQGYVKGDESAAADDTEVSIDAAEVA
ncbi:AlpA family transcriptional regulator [Amycolatopsis sp. DSM 110486]|uniref:helix-turn-helix transcriptional regulator n=1 Tax=Amycolatopsis sp. DSM 110486 TaxID=2865832 RepID=UPI001C6A67A0|nr:helix-turn-helix domain-containing protein [Amycolatopsis sp. DSM 110486]QYN16845.1 helix-turn-helix domain-containing protein [Amycolatopsis sp. DSM 110486]